MDEVAPDYLGNAESPTYLNPAENATKTIDISVSSPKISAPQVTSPQVTIDIPPSIQSILEEVLPSTPAKERKVQDESSTPMLPAVVPATEPSQMPKWVLPVVGLSAIGLGVFLASKYMKPKKTQKTQKVKASKRRR